MAKAVSGFHGLTPVSMPASFLGFYGYARFEWLKPVLGLTSLKASPFYACGVSAADAVSRFKGSTVQGSTGKKRNVILNLFQDLIPFLFLGFYGYARLNG